jgi:translation elongation factor EF-4
MFLWTPQNYLIHRKAGQVGFIMCNMRSTKEAHIGDTIARKGKKIDPLAGLLLISVFIVTLKLIIFMNIGFKPARPMVFAGVYPMDQSQHPSLRSAIERLVLTDPGVSLSISSSPALGQGWRLGFLGLLHLEVFAQRLEQEHGALAVLSAPSVTYKGKKI